jgi:UDP-N-acetylglucosamine acyltransferase
MAVHPTAIVEDGAQLGADVEIGPYCIVGRDARLHDGVRLLSHVVISGHTEIGANCVVHPHVVLGGESQIRGNDPTGTRLVVGPETLLRESVTISLGSRKGHGVTQVGARCYLMAYSHIGHDCDVGNDVTMANGAQLGGHVEIGDGVVLGGLAAVQQFGRIGRGAMLGGLSGGSEDIIPYGIAFGLHSQLAGLNIVGLKRRGVPRSSIHALRAAYRAIFLGETGSLAERATRAREEWGDVAEVREVVEFILAPAKRPICTARPSAPETAEE